jgi:hypothetical protein
MTYEHFHLILWSKNDKLSDLCMSMFALYYGAKMTNSMSYEHFHFLCQTLTTVPQSAKTSGCAVQRKSAKLTDNISDAIKI